MRIVEKVTLCSMIILLFVNNVYSADYSEIYKEIDDYTYSLFDEKAHDVINPSGWKDLRYSKQTCEFLEELDTSFQIEISYHSYYKNHHFNPSNRYNHRFKVNANIECFTTSYYDWKCLYRYLEIVDVRRPNVSSEGIFISNEDSYDLLKTIEGVVSEVY